MSQTNGRYDCLPTRLHVQPDGTAVAYRERRFLPRVAPDPHDRGVVVRAGDRLDSVAARALGDPLMFWRIADANAAMNPFDLAVAGAVLRLPGFGDDGSTS